MRISLGAIAVSVQYSVVDSKYGVTYGVLSRARSAARGN